MHAKSAKWSCVDMATQKEAVVNAIRAEISLATAQELIAVCIVAVHPLIHLSSVCPRKRLKSAMQNAFRSREHR